MKRESFEDLVARAVEDLPEEFAARLDNVVILVEDRPSKAQRFGIAVGGSIPICWVFTKASR